jgi:arylformamidase
MKIIDISVPISAATPVWEGDPPVVIHSLLSTDRGDMANVTRLELGAHTATHLDAPVHFVPGRKGVDQIPLETLIGPAFVAEFEAEQAISAADLEAAHIPPGTTRLLCKTSNSRLWAEPERGFERDFVGINHEGASWLVERQFQLVGVDYLGVERIDSVEQGAPVHHTLLGAELVIVEGLDLSQVEPGMYQLICLPLKIQNGDGAPCRAVLIQEGE